MKEQGYRTGVYKSNTVGYITGYIIDAWDEIVSATVKFEGMPHETVVNWTDLSDVA